jgi:hypothetical protein
VSFSLIHWLVFLVIVGVPIAVVVLLIRWFLRRGS